MGGARLGAGVGGAEVGRRGWCPQGAAALAARHEAPPSAPAVDRDEAAVTAAAPDESGDTPTPAAALEANPDYWSPQQFTNPSNPQARARLSLIHI